MKNRHKGILSAMISAIIFGSMPLMAKLTYNYKCNSISLVFYRFLFILPFLYLLVRRKEEESLKLTKEELKKILILSLVGYAPTPLFLFTAYSFIPSGLATTINFLFPVFVMLGAIIIYKEKPSKIKMVSVLLCFLGIITFYEKDGAIAPIGVFLAFLSSITYAFYNLYLDKSGLKDMYPFKLTFYLCGISSIVVLIFSLITGYFTVDIEPLGWLIILILSLSISLGGTCLFQVGVKNIGAQSTAILSTLEPITSIVLGMLIFKESYGLKTFLGICLILIAVILVSVFDKDTLVEEGDHGYIDR